MPAAEIAAQRIGPDVPRTRYGLSCAAQSSRSIAVQTSHRPCTACTGRTPGSSTARGMLFAGHEDSIKIKMRWLECGEP